MSKKPFIMVDGKPVEVSKEVYDAYFQPIWTTRYHAQKNGECHCTKADLWKCNGICIDCQFHADSRMISIYTPIGDEDDDLILEDILADDAPPVESGIMKKELLNALHNVLNRLDPDERYICDCIMRGLNFDAIAADIGIPKTTFNYQKKKLFSKIHEELKDFFF